MTSANHSTLAVTAVLIFLLIPLIWLCSHFYFDTQRTITSGQVPTLNPLPRLDILRSCWQKNKIRIYSVLTVWMRLFKGTGHYWLLLIIIFSLWNYLVTSNGELLIVYQVVRSGSLWSNTFFLTQNIKRLQLKSFIMHPKAHKVLQQGWFFFHCSLANSKTNWAIFLYRFVSLCNVCWDTPSENTGLWQLANLSSDFKGSGHYW